MTVLAHEAAVDKFGAALYTQAEASAYLGLPPTTFRSWARGYTYGAAGQKAVAAPVLSSVPPTEARGPNIPFVGLAEGYALAAMRRTGVPLQRIRPALARLDGELGLRHALASRRLYTDGAEVLFDFARHSSRDDADAVRELVVVRDDQRVFAPVVADYLQRIEFGADGFAEAIPLTGFDRAEVVADVRRSFGQPVFARGGARLEDVLALFKAERDLQVVSAEFGIPRTDLEDVLATMIRIG